MSSGRATKVAAVVAFGHFMTLLHEALLRQLLSRNILSASITRNKGYRNAFARIRAKKSPPSGGLRGSPSRDEHTQGYALPDMSFLLLGRGRGRSRHRGRRGRRSIAAARRTGRRGFGP